MWVFSLFLVKKQRLTGFPGPVERVEALVKPAGMGFLPLRPCLESDIASVAQAEGGGQGTARKGRTELRLDLQGTHI
jgi:hypothetical protein